MARGFESCEIPARRTGSTGVVWQRFELLGVDQTVGKPGSCACTYLVMKIQNIVEMRRAVPFGINAYFLDDFGGHLHGCERRCRVCGFKDTLVAAVLVASIKRNSQPCRLGGLDRGIFGFFHPPTSRCHYSCLRRLRHGTIEHLLGCCQRVSRVKPCPFTWIGWRVIRRTGHFWRG